jgi:hypothetical protein
MFANATILRLLGFDAERVPDDAEVALQFVYLPESWGVFVLLGLSGGMIYLAYHLYERENGDCPKWARGLLATLRGLTLLILILVLLGPAVTYNKVRTLRPVVSVVRDASDSMNETDAYRDPRAAVGVSRLTGKPVSEVSNTKIARAELVNQLATWDEGRFYDEIQQRGRLRLIDFTDRVKEVPLSKPEEADADAEGEPNEVTEPEVVIPPLVANGAGTDLGRALTSSLSERLTSAVVLLTDGQHNSQSDLSVPVLQAKKRNVPFFVLGLGDPERPSNLQVTEIYADPQVWKNDPFEIQATLRAQGIEEGEVEVSLLEVTPGDDPSIPAEEKLLESKQVELPEEGGQVRLTFIHKPEVEGMRSYTLRATPLENESSTEDNRPPAPVRVKVLDDNARVLMISGGPNWEYRALARLFTREENIDLSCWLQSLDDSRQQQGNTPIDRLPANREQLFEYDVVVMIDPDPREFNEEWVILLRSFVGDHAGGLLYMPGPVFGGPFLTDTSLANFTDLMPVTLGDIGSLEVSSLLTTFNRPWPLAIVAANVDQPIMRFYSDTEETLARWKRLPGNYWSFPAAAPKPAARVLIEHSDPSLRSNDIARPLLVTGNYGSGRTTYLGFDGTWRWRTPGLDGEFFKRFWVQTTRYLIEGRTLAGKRRGMIETSRFRYEVGDRIRITARLKQLNYEPMEDEEVTGLVEVPGQEPSLVTFKLVPNTLGLYETTITAANQGLHTVTINLPGEGAEQVALDASFSVILPIRETQATWLDKARLTEVATSSGGRYFELSEIDQLLDAIPDRIRRLETPSAPIPIWDTLRVLLLLAILLTLEWVLRKRFKML